VRISDLDDTIWLISYSILVAAGQPVGRWTERGIALGGMISYLTACYGHFIASSHLFRNPSTRIDPQNRRTDYERMQAFIFTLSMYSASSFQSLSIFKIVILLFVVITGWVVLSGKTRVADPHYNFRNAFAGSSTSSNDVRSIIFLHTYMLIMVLTVCYRHLQSSERICGMVQRELRHEQRS
jgi:L-type amino acid transporter 9